jgi:hypothetical protein
MNIGVNKGLLAKLLITLVAAIVVYSVFWFFKLGQVEKKINRFVSENSGNVSISDISVAGFPFLQRVTITDLRFNLPTPALDKSQVLVKSLEANAGIFQSQYDITINDKVIIYDQEGDAAKLEFNSAPEIIVAISDGLIEKISYKDAGYKITEVNQEVSYAASASSLNVTSASDEDDKVTFKISASITDMKGFGVSDVYKNAFEKRIIDALRTGELAIGSPSPASYAAEEVTLAEANFVNSAPEDLATDPNVAEIPVASIQEAVPEAVDQVADSVVSAVIPAAAPAQVVVPAVIPAAAPAQVVAPAVIPAAAPAQVVVPAVIPAAAPAQVVVPAVIPAAAPAQVVVPAVIPATPPVVAAVDPAQENIPATVAAVVAQVEAAPAATPPVTIQNAAPVAATVAAAENLPAPAPLAVENTAPSVNSEAELANIPAENIVAAQVTEVVETPKKRIIYKSDLDLQAEYILTPTPIEQKNPIDISQIQTAPLQYSKTIKIISFKLISRLHEVNINGEINIFPDDSLPSGGLSLRVSEFDDVVRNTSDSLREIAQKAVMSNKIQPVDLTGLSNPKAPNSSDLYGTLLNRIANSLGSVAREVADKNAVSSNEVAQFDIRREKNLQVLVNETPIVEILGKF